MIKKQTLCQGICDNCGAKITAWNTKSIVIDVLMKQNRALVVNGRTQHYCPRCWEQLKEGKNND